MYRVSIVDIARVTCYIFLAIVVRVTIMIKVRLRFSFRDITNFMVKFRAFIRCMIMVSNYVARGVFTVWVLILYSIIVMVKIMV